MRNMVPLGCLAGAVVAGAQEAKPPVFEVATMKLNKSGDPGQSIRRQPGGRVSATNMPLRRLIEFAYQIQPFQLVGGPGWLATEATCW